MCKQQNRLTTTGTSAMLSRLRGALAHDGALTVIEEG
jgi:hypothetical protein